ncbi:MAG: glutamate decarboxylase [Ferrimicrobium sp.]|uniref:Glutamate decarboxylase n=1 Tax=Ferrimicrobium acidiphilum TaxID=121039 RepID=A0ABV3Y199_9ACTN|nr:glutamate decarboxylase [Ferrimicrobium sp.]
MTRLSGNHEANEMSEGIKINPIYADGEDHEIPKYQMPQDGMSARAAYQMISDEIDLDGSARLNLATFVTTWMEPEADQLYLEAVDKNIVDKDEYPQTAAIEDRCIAMIGDLWHAPDPSNVIGTSTTGSSEACMLAGLALKRRWMAKRRALGKDTERPNIVFSSSVQVVWEKFANYFEVEPRYVPITREEPYLTPRGVLEVVDERTIGVVPILGVTYTGIYEPIAEIARALDGLAAASELDIPIHVDAASGGFVAPFLQPDLVWDFSLARVHSINTSGHKYGLVYPGLGWVLWRSKELLPEELIFKVSYLGGEMPTFGLNFSRPGAQVLLQYYNLVRLGFEGYRRVQRGSQQTAAIIAAGLDELPSMSVLARGSELPVVAWMKTADSNPNWNLHHLSSKLRERGWQVPVYPMPDNLADELIMRAVLRNGFRSDLAAVFVDDIKRAVRELDVLDSPMPTSSQVNGFHH